MNESQITKWYNNGYGFDDKGIYEWGSFFKPGDTTIPNYTLNSHGENKTAQTEVMNQASLL